MVTRDVRLLNSSYFVEGNAPVIELTGKTDKKESITILCRGFLPYFHVLEPTQAQTELLLSLIHI